MSMSLRGRLLAATLGVACVASVAAPAGAETMADAIALAYQNNPNLQAARANQRVTDESYVQARAGWRPTLNLNTSATYTENRSPLAARGAPVDRNGDGVPDPTVGIIEGNSARVGLSFSQPIWTGGRTGAAVSAAHADILQGRENLRRIEAQILTSVMQAYVDVRRDEEGLRIRRDNVAVLKRQLEESQARFDVGEITRTDVAQSQARLAQSESALQSAQAQLAISRATYAAVVGQNPGQLEPEPSLAYLLPTDPDAAFEIAEKNNPGLRAQEFAAQASRARLAGARAERLPNVSAQVSYGFNGPAIPEPPLDPLQRDLFTRGVTATVSGSVPLFAGGVITSRVRQSIERNNADRIGIETQRRTVLQSVTQLWNQLVATRANILSSDEQVSAARIAAEGTRQEQQVGLRTTIDVLNAEQELRAAELSQITARRDEYVSAVNLLGAMGRLEARNLIPTVPQYDAKRNFRNLRVTWGWVPWEEPIGIIDSLLTPKVAEKLVEPTVGPGLTPPPAPVSAPSAK